MDAGRWQSRMTGGSSPKVFILMFGFALVSVVVTLAMTGKCKCCLAGQVGFGRIDHSRLALYCSSTLHQIH